MNRAVEALPGPVTAAVHSSLEQLSEHFCWRLACTPAERDEVFALRYRVYCAELGWEDDSHCPMGMERDEFDAQASQALMVHRGSGHIVGCVRVVFAGDHDVAHGLPFAQIFGDRLAALTTADAELAHIFDQPQALCEFSRFAVASEFRRRRIDGPAPEGLPLHRLKVHDEDQRMVADARSGVPALAMGLVFAAAAIFLHSDARYAFALMAPALARLLAHGGFRLHAVSPPVEHRGRRRLYLIERGEGLSRTSPAALTAIATAHWHLYGRLPEDLPLPEGFSVIPDGVSRCVPGHCAAELIDGRCWCNFRGAGDPRGQH
ncbi:PEP-CTERM/exosortase system-associated acyltransferase [Plasticicumulans acidivorans]|uniref:N-acyl amino acid synthase of PEP-CTERM/exosortase system n=1 Tax=Plasticicumulans acidivorans TaxID=886464 RepID=A0A317MW76_9GAMM|nr:PEP-CTERM/exosortase system-associated acyltransferase [Plasticicumulans acidivorans]PWV63125.1 N-acyl amino acid synthase of PEP-CTERM/exosortase system [Plasticicumulans acidivorans]